MIPQFPQYLQPGPNSSDSSDTDSGRGPPNYQPVYGSPDMLRIPVHGHAPFDPIVAAFPPFECPQYLTGPESDLVGNDAFPPLPFLPGYHRPQTVVPFYPSQPSFFHAEPSYSDSDNPPEIHIAGAGGQEVVRVGGMGPPFPAQDAPFPNIPPTVTYFPNGPPGPIHDAQYATSCARIATPSGSTSGASGSACPTAPAVPHMQRTSSSGRYQAFIEDTPVLNTLSNLVKERVGTHPIVEASMARRKNPAPLVCDYCQATFTRTHNLGYHMDSHLGIKNHPSLCGKRFGTPSGSKRHQNKCSKCRDVSSSMG